METHTTAVSSVRRFLMSLRVHTASTNLLAPLTKGPIKIRVECLQSDVTRSSHQRLPKFLTLRAITLKTPTGTKPIPVDWYERKSQSFSQLIRYEKFKDRRPGRCFKRCRLELSSALFGQRFSSAVLEHLKVYARPMSVKYVWFESRTRMTLPHSSHQSAYL